jgi:hypothetical protein
MFCLLEIVATGQKNAPPPPGVSCLLEHLRILDLRSHFTERPD